MKTVWLLLPLVLAVSACVMNGPIRGDAQAGSGSAFEASAPLAPATTPAFPPQPDMTPRLMQPVTGGAPVVGIPLGGTLFQPVTGGPPVVGIPLTP
jgi:hypothetical protein